MGEYRPRSFWYEEVRCVQEGSRATFSQYCPELVRVYYKALPNTAALLPARFCQPNIDIAHNARGHYRKIRPRVLANHSARYIFKTSSHVIIVY